MRAILLIGYAALLLWEAWHLGITADEPSHLTAGYMYWLNEDVLYPSDTPPLTRMISGWVPRLLNLPVRRDTDAWKSQNSYDIGGSILDALDARGVHRLIFCTRVPFLIFPLLTVSLVWHWGRELFGARLALALAACAALEPTILGHGALIKSDEAATFTFLLFAWCGWRYWRVPDMRRLIWMTLALLLAILAKFSMLALIPIGIVLVAWRGPRLAGIPLLLATLYLGLLLAYQFRLGPDKADWPQWQDVFTPRERAAGRILGHLPWPPQFLRGIRFIGNASRGEGFAAYMLGQRIRGAAPWYYPLAFAVKFPIPLQILTLAGLGALAARIFRRQAGAADLFLWGPALFLLALTVQSHFHIGFRHAMPVLPILILGAGFALQRWCRFRIPAALLMAWLAIASMRIYPQGISYFNEWIGGPGNGWRYLSDSNLDWGQNLPELARYVEEHRIPQIRLCYFGSDSAARYLPGKFVEDLGPHDISQDAGKRFEPSPGVYAISVSALTGVAFPNAIADYFAWFRGRKPEGRAGYSILIYNVNVDSPPQNQGRASGH